MSGSHGMCNLVSAWQPDGGTPVPSLRFSHGKAAEKSIKEFESSAENCQLDSLE